jgi:hypothetical protein
MNATRLSAACGRCIVVVVALGGFLSSLPAQTAPAAPAPAPADAMKKPVPVETAPAANASGSDEAVVLSPFEVVSNAKGYYGSNTMSGTRFNTKLEDLASSITVITKEQMADFAMLDINDIFLYTANTEGTGTYTDFVIDRNGSVADNVQLNPNNANRVRGIAPANVSLGNIETMNRVPIDPLSIDAIEVSRGPNANVFGLGNPSGTLNQVAAAANTTRDRTQIQVRADSYDGFRESLDVNRVLLKNKLAVRFSQVFQHDGYVRKPSGTNTVRYNGMIKYQPFKSTSIAASYSFYRLNGNRPNALPPRDNISYWIASGRPTWDPTTQQIHINGVTVGTFPAPSYNGPDYFSASILGATRNQMFIDRNGLSYWSIPNGTNNGTPLPGTTVAGPTSGPQAVRFLQTTGTGGATGFAATPASQPLFSTTPTVRDKSIYDWSSINLSAPNRLIDRVLTTNVQIDQRFFETARHALFGQAAFLREDAQRYARNLIGTANALGQSGQLEIDPNERLLDGSPNPYFLRPFIGTDKPPTVLAPAKWDTYRAQLAYKLDFARDSGWRRWLGTHQIAGYREYKYRINRQYSFRDVITSPNPWLPPGVYRANQFQVPGTPTVVGITQGFHRYYVSDNQGTRVDYAPQEFAYGTYPFVWGNATTRVWRSENSTVGPGATTDSSGGSANVKQITRTGGGVIHSHFLNDRLVVTYGQRQDNVYAKFGNTSPQLQLLNSDGLTFNYPLINAWADGDYRYNTGKTTNTQFVVRPFRGLAMLASLERAGGAGRFAADALRGLSLTYNKSDSFTPATPAQDLFLKVLPNPSGEDRSWGFGLNLLEGRAVLRVTRYENAQRNGRNGDTSTIAQRIIRTDLVPATTTPAPFVLENQVTAWVTQDPAHATWTQAQIQAEVARQMGLGIDLQNALSNPSPPIAATQDIVAKGTEVELNLNLTRYWTVAASATDTQSITANVSTAVAQWAAQRMAIWTTIKDPRGADRVFGTADDGPVNWWTQNYGGTQTAAQNYAVFVESPYNVLKQKEGKTNPQIRRYAARISTNFRFAGVTEHNFWKKVNVGGALRWEDRGAIGYYGIQDAAGTYIALDPSKPIYNRAHTYVDAFVGYRTRIFRDKIGTTIQLNVQNLQESGRLQPTGAFPDGTKNAFRIIDPRKFILTATFEL